mgnify:CR=1 FL=1
MTHCKQTKAKQVSTHLLWESQRVASKAGQHRQATLVVLVALKVVADRLALCHRRYLTAASTGRGKKGALVSERAGRWACQGAAAKSVAAQQGCSRRQGEAGNLPGEGVSGDWLERAA